MSKISRETTEQFSPSCKTDLEFLGSPEQATNPTHTTEISGIADSAFGRINEAGRLVDAYLGNDVPTVSIIIPAFNEMGTIDTVVNSIRSLPVSKQIIVVDDGSTDGTRQYIERLHELPGVDVCLHEVNSGKGAAIQSGIQRAIGEIVIVQDADLEYEPTDILKVIEPIVRGESDVVYGSRYLTNPKQDGSALHRFGNRVLTGLSNLATGQKLTDMETCYKAFRRELIQSIRIEQNRFGFEPEITAKLARKKVLIHEVPIGYKPRSWDEGKKIGVKDLINTLWCIVRYRLFS
ncbi:glycosyltransferase family 2 protein [Pirellulaceae bacterium SH449]